MKTVTASEFQKNFGAFKEVAQREPVAITSNGRESVVLISAADYMAYQKLKNESQNEVTEGFKKKTADFMDKHDAVFKGLAK